MIFRETDLEGAFLVEMEPRQDERGFFARSFCREEFAAHGLPDVIAQCNVSFNRLKGTLRGMHFQAAPKEEGKLVRCTRGAIYDVIIDLRPDSPTFCAWIGEELTEENLRALYVPPGFAHGFQTLRDGAEVLYYMTEFYDGLLARGVRWNDPAFSVRWPVADLIISDRDRNFPDFQR